MTPKQQKFADNYIKTANATKSAVLAGYSKKTASAIGLENLEKPIIKAYIDKQLSEMHSDTIASAKDVMEYLTSVMMGKQTESVVTNKGIVKDVEVSAKDRIKAAELIGKRHSLFTDKVEQTNTNIEIDVGDWDDE
ncbi:terminase small subunit (plasmid) [Lactobacillus curvatus]|nr:terminase small subunit [Latilactobacillus curvatus]MSD84725.1 terminase small subunit [Latilactobacillus curvatus]MSE23461.1 terminase small subunit [Latilactobacillus curvatus]MSE24925.1 terminase small subunit [Latilactobacillus curvatus]